MKAGLQKTKWFRCDVYNVAGSVLLTAGRHIPDAAESFQRGEGIARAADIEAEQSCQV